VRGVFLDVLHNVKMGCARLGVVAGFIYVASSNPDHPEMLHKACQQKHDG
jgi:hypothetical protein